MKKTKFLGLTLIISMIAIVLAGCGAKTSKSYTFELETGDNVQVELDTTKKYDLTAKTPISFTKDGDEIAKAIFDTFDKYNTDYQRVKSTSSFEIIEEKNDNNGEYYLLKSTEKKRYIYYIKIKDASNTCFIIDGECSESEIRDLYNRITLTVEE